jgi:hypothetical protein
MYDLSEGPRWDRLAKLLELAVEARSRGKLNMKNWFGPSGGRHPTLQADGWCNTSACLAGHTVSYWENPLWERDDRGQITINIGNDKGNHVVPDAAAEILGLFDDERTWLFCSIADREVIDPEDEDEIDKVLLLLTPYMSVEDAAIAHLSACINAREIIHPTKFFTVRGNRGEE